MAKLIPLFSGSSGNSYCLSSGGSTILIDMGQSAKKITEALDSNGVNVRKIEAIFITHEHTDHVKGLRVFANRHGIPVYMSQGTKDAVKKNNYVDEKTRCNVIERGGLDLSTMHVSRFPISHDCAEGIGFKVDTGSSTFAIATDLGIISYEVIKALTGCNTVVIESNHDLNMLQMSSYPYMLKRRIMSEKGHLSNADCSSLLPQLVKSGTSRFVLAHLSKENNMPEIAYRESLNMLNSHNMKISIDFTLDVAAAESSGLSVVF